MKDELELIPQLVLVLLQRLAFQECGGEERLERQHKYSGRWSPFRQIPRQGSFHGYLLIEMGDRLRTALRFQSQSLTSLSRREWSPQFEVTENRQTAVYDSEHRGRRGPSRGVLNDIDKRDFESHYAYFINHYGKRASYRIIWERHGTAGARVLIDSCKLNWSGTKIEIFRSIYISI